MSKMIRRCLIVLVPLLVLGLSTGGLLLTQPHNIAQAAQVQKKTTTPKRKGAKKRKSKKASSASSSAATPSATNPNSASGSSGKRSRKTQPQPQTQTQGGGSPVSQAAQSVFDQINSERAGDGKPPLKMIDALIRSAHAHNLTMQEDNQLEHELSNEPKLGDRISQQGVNWSSAAENIGFDGSTSDPTGSAKSLNTEMFNERPPDDGHRQNILSTSVTQIGIDVLVDNQNGKTWLTEDFAG